MSHPPDPEQHMLILNTAEGWARQAREALAALEAANGGPFAHLRDVQPKAPVAFARLVQALDALAPLTGKPVADEVLRLAGLRPIDEVLG